MMKIIKQNYRRWLLNALALLILGLGARYFNRQNEILFTLFYVGFCCVLFYVCMRPAILHPKKHKVAWCLFAVPVGWLFLVWLYAFCKLFFDPNAIPQTDPSSLKGIRETFGFWTFLAFILSFFLDRNEESNRKDIVLRKVRSVYFMVLASVAYAFPVWFGFHGREFAGLVPLMFLPLYVVCLFVWLYRGWGKWGCLFGLLLVPLIVSSFLLMLP